VELKAPGREGTRAIGLTVSGRSHPAGWGRKGELARDPIHAAAGGPRVVAPALGKEIAALERIADHEAPAGELAGEAVAHAESWQGDAAYLPHRADA
jgi:hypothetical protein